ncbi:cell adhesion molecule 1-like isoform X2 [Pangasianodon hypophthalmus]|uniref:cell adhesion molecule 1-like isoform X2 n=1 Tax=Pangasianodon hypophthalmus TaxID=310915 RepID=UPI002307E653|nr:cell adhesion molecule 1-like isoform X2 [Pangasianodon hypophthalmus]
MHSSTGLTGICVVLLFLTEIKAIRVIGQDVTVAAGDDAHLFCQLVETREPLTSITWQRRTKEKPANTDFVVITSDGKEGHINGLRDRVKFTVPPVVSVSMDVPPVAGDAEAILATCTAANGKPAAEVLWSLGALSDSVKVQSNVTVDSEGRSTVKRSLIGVASKDLNQKKVQCLVTHPGLKGKLELNYTLIIHYPPEVVYINSTGDQGKAHEYQCEADANPKPTNFIWSRHFPVKEPLSSSANSRQIIQLTPDSNGVYYCVVSNQYGKAVGSLYVHAAYTESTACWTLFIIALFAGVCGFLIWKFNLHQHITKRLRCISRDPVPTVSSDQDEES